MEEDWDLHAVVRGCSATPTAVTATTVNETKTPSFAAADCFYKTSSNSSVFPFGRDQTNHLFSLQDHFEATTSSTQELHDLYKPFFFKSQPQTSPPPPPPPLPPLSPPHVLPSPTTTLSPPSSSKPQSQQKQHNLLPKQSHAGSTISAPRSKRRKNQLKKVCQVPAESLSSDIWAWRKYGQKPIKGSPYPRGYYRCSSSKGCMARKQVERNRSDPGMFIVTYTAEHNHPAPTHRNSLAGSTRQKPVPTQPVDGGEPNKTESNPTACSPSRDDEVLAQSTVSESKEEKEDLVEDEEDNDLGISDMIVNDDFFVGFEELDSPDSGDYFSDQFPANFGIPWLFNNAATAAGGI